MDAERDDIIEQAAAALRHRQWRSPRAIARILATVEGRPRRWWRAVTWPSAPFSLAATGSLAAAALLLGFLTRQATDRPDNQRQLGGIPAARTLPVLPAVRSTGEALPLPVQFTLRDVQASQVALVGDFNGWSSAATPLEPGEVPGTWSVTIPLSAGRHVYAFLVDGKTWMTDPRAQTARDLDFGRANSVLIVQAP
ncbi:MAG: isoamylase early set domain-containing protein [Gemmatimonadota bacterium]